MNAYLPPSENGIARQAQLELVNWSIPPRMQYADLAGRYVAALESTVNVIAGEAQLVAGTRLGQPGDAEVAAWRIDGDILDGEFDFATRASMTVNRADERATARDCLLAEPIVPHRVVPMVRKELGSKGLYIAGVEYKKVPLKKEDGPLLAINRQYAKFARVAENGFMQQAYSANHRQSGEVVRFPRLPAFESLASLGYAAFCLSKVEGSPIARKIAAALARAAEKDKTASYKPDDLIGYAEVTAGMSRDVEGKIRILGQALYQRASDESLSPELAAAMLEPNAATVAYLGRLNKTKYVQSVPKLRGSTPALHNQLAVVMEYASQFQGEIYPLMLADKAGYDAAMKQELTKAKSAVDTAEAFHVHLSAPETISLDPSHWEVRGTL